MTIYVVGYDRTFDRIHHALYVQCREQADARPVRPPPLSIASREVGGKRGICIDPHGYDAGKKIKGKKRHFLVDTQGLLLQPSFIARMFRIATAACC